MTIYRTILSKGYFPKELPPAFFSEEFAIYATTKAGRAALQNYVPADKFTESVKYNLASPGLNTRELRVVHPHSFADLASLVAKHFSRLLKRAGTSKFLGSRPSYSTGRERAIQPSLSPWNQAPARAGVRAGARFLLKADVSHFYPSLYTHAVGWAVDQALRQKKNWRKKKLLGALLDQALMNSERKISQGIPIGNDVSFLLAEIVLAQVDVALGALAKRAYRWFDDYELAFDSHEEAEQALRTLNRELAKFRLRLNSEKTEIILLPQPTQDAWRDLLYDASRVPFSSPQQMVRYFDEAFRLREQFPKTAVLQYALGLLFKLSAMKDPVCRMALSGISQALLCEPGVAQKAFALLSFWRLNGISIDVDLIKSTIAQMILRHRSRGPTSDIAWSLAYCLQEKIALGIAEARVLSEFDDDCIALQALDMESRSLLPKGYSSRLIRNLLKQEDLNREHWLLAYETVRHGFLTGHLPTVASNPLFSDMLAKGVTFYRKALPPYASVIHPGGGPAWLVRSWVSPPLDREQTRIPLQEIVEEGLRRVAPPQVTLSPADKLIRLMGAVETDEFQLLLSDETYSV